MEVFFGHFISQSTKKVQKTRDQKWFSEDLEKSYRTF
jgi:hypothetical protein